MPPSNPLFSIPDWLEALELQQYADAFSANGVTIGQLFSLNESDLSRIGVAVPEARQKILAAIEELRACGGENMIPAGPVSAAPPDFKSAGPLFIPPATPAAASPVAKKPTAVLSVAASRPANGPAPAAVIVPAKPAFWDRFGGRFLYISIAVHLIFGLLATWYVVQRIEAKRKLTFQAGNPSNPNTRAVEHKVQVVKKLNNMSAPAQAKRITTTAVSARVSIPEMEMPTSSNVAPSRMVGMGGAGFGTAPTAMTAGVGSGGGGAGGVPFFGLRLDKKRIAFLLDYSATMDGPFRLELEKELEKTLSGMPAGTQVIVILWAGPAWLYNEHGNGIVKNWKNNGEFDEWERVPGSQQATPTWINIDADKTKDIMSNLRRQKIKFGTSWVSPFDYAMEVSPAPDVICFLTDCQIAAPRIDAEIKQIDKILAKAPKRPPVNCFWIRNKDFKPDMLRTFARRHQGSFAEVGQLHDRPPATPPPKK